MNRNQLNFSPGRYAQWYPVQAATQRPSATKAHRLLRRIRTWLPSGYTKTMRRLLTAAAWAKHELLRQTNHNPQGLHPVLSVGCPHPQGQCCPQLRWPQRGRPLGSGGPQRGQPFVQPFGSNGPQRDQPPGSTGTTMQHRPPLPAGLCRSRASSRAPGWSLPAVRVRVAASFSGLLPLSRRSHHFRQPLLCNLPHLPPRRCHFHPRCRGRGPLLPTSPHSFKAMAFALIIGVAVLRVLTATKTGPVLRRRRSATAPPGLTCYTFIPRKRAGRASSAQLSVRQW